MLCFVFAILAESAAQSNFRVMFYNVENLFDTQNDPLKNDDEFLPEGRMNWTSQKYRKKLKNISQVITGVGEMHPPAIVGLCEIENDRVISDLVRKSALRAQGYEYIITDSPDERGIDVALLYQPHRYKLLKHSEYGIVSRNSSVRPTRNILHAEGKVISGDTLDVFVCHFPSRSGGKRETEPARINAAALLRSKIDSLFATRRKANIIVMGDFNDRPNDKSLFRTLKARSLNYHRSNGELYNLFFHRLKEPDFGSYLYQGRWEMLDQFIVSGFLLNPQNSITVKEEKAYVFKADFLLQNDAKSGGKRPFRTNLGPKYLGGFSDHLPVFMDLLITR